MPREQIQKLTEAGRAVLPRQPRARGVQAGNLASKQARLEAILTELLRFEGRFNSRLEHAFQALDQSADTRLRHLAMSRRLSYVTTALDIAVGPNPELNLFDMIAFLKIGRSALGSYWIPNVFGADGSPLVEAFDASIAELSKILNSVINDGQKEELFSFITNWIEHHPEHYAAENFRFSSFPESLREEAASSDARGIMQLIQHANRALTTADTMRLLAERVFQYAQRAPFLTRLHVRAALYELLSDGMRSLRSKKFGNKLLEASFLVLLASMTLNQLRSRADAQELASRP